jgi:hypothetical protein
MDVHFKSSAATHDTAHGSRIIATPFLLAIEGVARIRPNA